LSRKNLKRNNIFQGKFFSASGNISINDTFPGVDFKHPFPKALHFLLSEVGDFVPVIEGKEK